LGLLLYLTVASLWLLLEFLYPTNCATEVARALVEQGKQVANNGGLSQ